MAAVRVAIVADTEAAQPAADVLTAALSSDGRIQLVERTELNRVIAEQALVVWRDPLRIGQLLGADGVVLLGLSGTESNQTLRFRLMAVKPGVVIRDFSAAWPPPDLKGWSSELGQRLGVVWPKLAVLPKDAVPISILNLRSALRTSEAESLERELTGLLQYRLIQQPEVFVLERRRLELLAEEKELGTENSPFWAGGYLLEGLINKERFETDKVTISGRLIPPDKGKSVPIELEGTRTNLPGLIEALARQVLTAVKAGVTLAEWNPGAEAAEYWDEACWAAKWGMWREAQAASEVCWALGRQTKEVAEMRVRAWRETGKNRAACIFELKQVIVNYSAPPEANAFAELRRAADLFEAGWKQFVAGQTPLDATWFELGTALVADLSTWLRHYYFMPEAREGQESALQQTQQQADRICRLLAAHPDYPDCGPKALLAQARALWGSLWVQTPEAGLKLYRELAAAGEWPLVRKRFLNSFCFAQEDSHSRVSAWPEGFYDPASPLLTGWKWSDRQRWLQVWSGFVDEWCNSPDPLVAIEGRYLRCALAWFGEDYERELRELLQLVWAQRDALASANLLDGWRVDLRKLVGKSNFSEPVPDRLAGLIPERRKRIESEMWPAFERTWDDFIKAQAATEQRRQLMSEARKYFATRNDYDFPSLVRWQREQFSPDEARELLPLVQSYRERLHQLPAGTLRGMAWSNSLTRFEAGLQATATGIPVVRSTPVTNAAASRSPSINGNPPVLWPPGGMRPPGGVAGMPPRSGATQAVPVVDLNAVGATNWLRGPRFWQLPNLWQLPNEPQPEADKITALLVTDVLYRDEKLWAQVVFSFYEPYTYHLHHRAIVCGIDPVTLETETFAVESDQGIVPSANAPAGVHHFEIYRQALFFNVGKKLRRFDFARRCWETVPVPVEGRVQMYVVQDRLYLRTDDSILLLNATGDGAEIVASNRRHPTQNALDQVAQLGSSGVFTGPTGAVWVAAQNKLWTYSTAQQDWTVVAELPAPAHCSSEGILYRKSSPGWDEEIYIWLAGQPAPVLGLRQPPDQMGAHPPLRGLLQPGHDQTSAPAPRWELPVRLRPLAATTALAPDRLWSFAGTIAVGSDQGVTVLKEINGRQGLLFGFHYHHKAPVIIPLKLEMPRYPARGLMLSGSSVFKPLLRATPAGLVLTHYGVPGFWLLPQAELDRQWQEWLQHPPLVTYPESTNANRGTLNR
jgi:hypothetical protein